VLYIVYDGVAVVAGVGGVGGGGVGGGRLCVITAATDCTTTRRCIKRNHERHGGAQSL